MRADDSANLPGIYVRELLDLCGRFEVTPDEVLAGSGVTHASLSDPATRVPLETVTRIVERALVLTGEPSLPYLFGMHMRISWHGFLGFAAMTAPTVRDALRLAERYASTRTFAVQLTLREDEGHGVLVFEPRVALGALHPHLVIALFSGLRQLAEALTGAPIEADVDLSFPEPDTGARFSHLLPGRVRYDQPVDRVWLGPGLLERRVVTADPVAMELARDQCERELAAIAPGLGIVEQVQRHARVRDGAVPTVEEVARKLHVSTRTLKRRLAEHATSFSEVVDRARHRDALLLLVDTRLSIDEIASRLGYSDAANFTRAFKRWTGTTPAAHRAKERGAAG